MSRAQQFDAQVPPCWTSLARFLWQTRGPSDTWDSHPQREAKEGMWIGTSSILRFVYIMDHEVVVPRSAKICDRLLKLILGPLPLGLRREKNV